MCGTSDLAANAGFFGELFESRIDRAQPSSFYLAQRDLAIIVEVIRFEVFLGGIWLRFAHLSSQARVPIR